MDAINSPVLKRSLKMSHNNIKKMDCFKRFINVPWKKESVRTFRTLYISRSKIFFVRSFNLLISGNVSPRLFTNSIFLRDSVINPACVFVSRLILRCTDFILRVSIPVSPPRTRFRHFVVLQTQQRKVLMFV